MQDKEIDHLFKSKLEGLEVEPSERAWSGINTGLDKNKKGLKTYLSIAACLLVLFSAGLYFVSQIKDPVKKPVQITVTKNNKPLKTIIQPVAKTPVIAEPRVQKVLITNNIKRTPKKKLRAANTVLPAVKEAGVEPEQQLAQLQLPENRADEVKFTVPDRSVPLNEKVEITGDVPFKSNSLTAQQLPVSKTIAAVPAKKHRIRSLGDLINVVVSKVDKRKDKLIEFSTPADEDETIVSGINLGFIKIKKDQ